MAKYQVFPSAGARAVFQNDNDQQVSPAVGHHVAINYITVQNPSDLKRFTELFAARSRAADSIPGFLGMQLLEPQNDTYLMPGQAKNFNPETGISERETPVYLVITHWKDEKSFQNWTKSSQFIEGHRQDISDTSQGRILGNMNPASSQMKMYKIVSI